MTMHPRPFRRPTTAPHSPTVAVVGALATALTLAACGGGGGNEGPRVDQALAQQGQSVFRYETFG
ncbi:MAG: hypothetical protein LC137_00630, partial [Burkholderiales bacterium]|nr:hypothetical protein [Burkholderiales bacterium]